jgi:hypothetical protein
MDDFLPPLLSDLIGGARADCEAVMGFVGRLQRMLQTNENADALIRTTMRLMEAA